MFILNITNLDNLLSGLGFHTIPGFRIVIVREEEYTFASTFWHTNRRDVIVAKANIVRELTHPSRKTWLQVWNKFTIETRFSDGENKVEK
jgi:hypothetical protein